MQEQEEYFSNQFLICREHYGNKRYRVDAEVFLCGNDIVVVIGGGTKRHVGAVALAVPRPSLADQSQISASVSVLCVVGHKDDQLARSAALRLATALNCITTVISGVHIDNASEEDINVLITNCEHVLNILIDNLKTLLLNNTTENNS